MLNTLKALKRIVVFATRVAVGLVALTVGGYLFFENPWHHLFLWSFLISINLIASASISLWDWYHEKPRFSIRKWFHDKCVEGFPPEKPVVVPAPPRRRKLGHKFSLRSTPISRG